MLLDHEIMEITIDDGLACAFFEIPFVKSHHRMELSIETKGVTEVYQIR